MFLRSSCQQQECENFSDYENISRSRRHAQASFIKEGSLANSVSKKPVEHVHKHCSHHHHHHPTLVPHNAIHDFRLTPVSTPVNKNAIPSSNKKEMNNLNIESLSKPSSSDKFLNVSSSGNKSLLKTDLIQPSPIPNIAIHPIIKTVNQVRRKIDFSLTPASLVDSENKNNQHIYMTSTPKVSQENNTKKSRLIPVEVNDKRNCKYVFTLMHKLSYPIRNVLKTDKQKYSKIIILLLSLIIFGLIWNNYNCTNMCFPLKMFGENFFMSNEQRFDENMQNVIKNDNFQLLPSALKKQIIDFLIEETDTMHLLELWRKKEAWIMQRLNEITNDLKTLQFSFDMLSFEFHSKLLAMKGPENLQTLQTKDIDILKENNRKLNILNENFNTFQKLVVLHKHIDVFNQSIIKRDNFRNVPFQLNMIYKEMKENKENSISMDKRMKLLANDVKDIKHFQENIYLDVKNIIKEEIKMYDSDKLGQIDFALFNSGGRVVQQSKNYHDTWSEYFTDDTQANEAIKPSVLPGDCWSSLGTEAFLIVRLSHMIFPTSFAIEHVAKSISTVGHIKSAPNVFTIYGLSSENDVGFLFGNYSYDIDGDTLQIYPIQYSSAEPFQLIKLNIHSNHGNLGYTCLYRFRVHGTHFHKT